MKSAHFFHRNSRGFTLIELLLVVSVISVITAITIPNFNTYLNNQNVTQATEQIKSDMRSVQNKAMTGVGQTLGNTYWMMRFVGGQNTYTWRAVVGSATLTANEAYTLCAANAADEKSTPLNSTVVLSTAAVANKCVFFKMNTGDIYYHYNAGVSPGTLMSNCGDPTLNGTCEVSVGYSGGTTNCGQVGFNFAGMLRAFTGGLCNI